MKKNLPISHVERDYADSANILSTTNLKGAISYFNDDFLEISGFEAEELLHKNHNVVRHPEMPPAAFQDLWTTIKSGKSWMGMVKNRCKNGDHYWVDAFVTPIRKNGETVEYQSVRRKPKREYVERAETLYKQIFGGKTPRALKTPKLGLESRLILASGASLVLAGMLTYAGLDASLATIFTFFGAAAVLSSAALFILLRPLKIAFQTARDINNNPVARYVYTGRNDEAGDILLAFKTLQAETSGLVGRISDDAKNLSAKATDLTSAIETTDRNVQRQFEETEQVATAINEMSATIGEVASNSQATADAVAEALAEASKGHNIVNTASASIEDLSRELEKASEVITKVESYGQEISSILDVIKGVSEQTNLLALNAAIEAARAGEQGRGFAVVADEVRGLATRTNEATEQIQRMIETLQQGTQEAVGAMSKSRDQATSSVDQARSAGASIGIINGVVERIKDMSITVASAVEEQSAVAEEINKSVHSIRDASEQTMEVSTQVSEASDALTNLATGLRDLSGEFWVKNTGR